jgi:hypothetical protein
VRFEEAIAAMPDADPEASAVVVRERSSIGDLRQDKDRHGGRGGRPEHACASRT